jgi:hypothetical protein
VVSRDDAQAVFARMLIDKVRQDEHPSSTQMALLEQTIPRELIGDYLEVLMDKVVRDPVPSITMLHRIRRVTEML